MKHVISASRIAFVFALLVGLLVTQSPAQEAAAQAPQRYIVVLSSGASPQAVAQDHALQTEYIYRHALNGFSAVVPPGRLTALQRDPRVAFVEADQPAHIFAQTVPTGIERIFASSNVELDIDGSDDYRVDVDVAVIDTGIDFDHPDLNVVFRTNCAKGGPFNQSCTDGDGDDGNGHGSHVAGTIAAIDNNVGVVGVAPGARLWAIKVLRDDGSGWISWVIAGIDRVTALKESIEVANMSLGCECSSSAMDTAIANSVDAGVAYAVAAGNSDKDAATFSPANHPDVLTVSALADFNGVPGGLGSPTCRSDQDDTLADFSNWGLTIEIAAPGVCILSTWKGGGYNTISGTSMASPHAAGALALLASINNPSNEPSVKALYQTLKANGNFNWTDDSGDGVREPLLDVSNATVFNPVLVAGLGAVSDTTPPAAPANLTATAGDKKVNLDWTDNTESDLAGYNVYRATSLGGPYTTKVNSTSLVTSSAYTDTAVSAGTTYYYVVTAVDGSGNESGNSNEASATPVDNPPAAPTNLTATAGGSQVNLDWTDNTESDLAGYNIYRSPTLGGPYTTKVNSTSLVTSSAYTDTGLTNGQRYCYVVRAVDTASQESSSSNEACATPQIVSTMHVGDLDGSSTNQGTTWTAIVSITVHASDHVAVEAANVSGTFTWNGNAENVSCATNSGQCSVSKSGIPKKNGSATFTVTSVGGTLDYDAKANHDPDGDSNGTSIVVNKP